MISDLMASRQVGKFPISIPTSLIMESLCNIHDEIQHQKMPLLEYGLLYINLKTLFRNLFGSLETDQKLVVTPEEMAAALLDEVNQITQICKEYNPNLTVRFYVPNYANLESRYKFALIRMDNTERQKYYTSMLMHTVGGLLKLMDKTTIDMFSDKLTKDYSLNTLIMTHYAYDLIWHRNFRSLALAESHTGKIKTRAQFYTKYEHGKDLVRIPFHIQLLQVFGDSETFRPLNIKLRKDLIELAEQCHWTQTTTEAKVKFDLDKLKNPFARDMLKQLF